jgi:hypothetical protein
VPTDDGQMFPLVSKAPPAHLLPLDWQFAVYKIRFVYKGRKSVLV